MERNPALAGVEVREAIKTWLSVEDDPGVLAEEVAVELEIVQNNLANLEIDDGISDDEDGEGRPSHALHLS